MVLQLHDAAQTRDHDLLLQHARWQQMEASEADIMKVGSILLLFDDKGEIL